MLIFKKITPRHPRRVIWWLMGLTFLLPFLFAIIFISPIRHWPESDELELFMILGSILHFVFYAAIPSALLTVGLNWKILFKK